MVLLVIKDNNWVEITQEEKKKLPKKEQEKVLFIHRKLMEKLDFAIKQQEKKNDVVGIIDGNEGSGKSSLAANIMRYISKDKFNPREDMVGSDYEDAIDKIQNRKNKGFLMFDEGNVFFLSTEVMKREARNLHKIFSIFRQKNLFVLIVLPSFFRLSSYFAIDRSRFLIRTYQKKDVRGFFAYYGDKRKDRFYQQRKIMHSYKQVNPNFRGRFSQCYLLEDNAYQDFKLRTLTDSITVATKKKELTPAHVERYHLKKIIALNPDKTIRELEKILGASRTTISKVRIAMREEEMLKN